MEFVYILLLSVVVVYAEFRLTCHNWGAQFNGVGCIPAVLAGNAKQPMQYRVLVPWLVGNVERGDYVKRYIYLRVLSVIFALWASNLWFGNILYTSAFALFLIAAAKFDYTDGYLEVGLFALVFYLIGNPISYHYELICLLVLVAAINRETAVFLPITALLGGYWFLGIGMLFVFGVGYIIPRLKYGKCERYCNFFMVKENLRRIKERFKKEFFLYNEYTLFFILFALFVFGYVGTYPDYTFYQVSMGLMFFALLIPSIWCEVRVFKPVLLVLIPMVVR